MTKRLLAFWAAAFVTLVTIAPSLNAQEAPAPQKMPRVPVTHQLLSDSRDSSTFSHQVTGLAAIIDGEKLRIGDSDLRLFGIVPPQLAASFGPQARSALDALANGQTVTCQIRDRDRDGRLLATCMNSSGVDMALDLLKRGLAVTARGSLTGTELSAPYMAAEQNAQNQKIGLWSTASFVQILSPAVVPTPAVSTSAKDTTTSLTPPSDTKKDEKVTPRSDKAALSETDAKIASDIVDQHSRAQQAQLDINGWEQTSNVGFFERYQILIAGFLMLVTALSIITALWAQKRRDRRDEIRAVAAALRGELMAARGVCVGRMKSITSESEDIAAAWPRIRVTLYQAYVGRLGLLGAELARQIASVYGQSSDYASLYSANASFTDVPKKQALESLIRNIDEILPKLASIEHKGSLPSPASTWPSEAYTPRVNQVSSSLISKRLPTPSVTAPVKPQEMLRKPFSQELSASKSEEEKPKENLSYESAPATAETASSNAASMSKTPVALWEAVRGFIQNHKNAISSTSEQNDTQLDPHVAAYAAMIEADMARYHYAQNIENFDKPRQKKQG